MSDKLRAALQSVVDDCENCDWTCERCGKDYGMTETDLYSAAKKALSDPAPAETTAEQAKAKAEPFIDNLFDAEVVYVADPNDLSSPEIQCTVGVITGIPPKMRVLIHPSKPAAADPPSTTDKLHDDLAQLLREHMEVPDNWPGVAYTYDLEKRAKATIACYLELAAREGKAAT